MEESSSTDIFSSSAHISCGLSSSRIHFSYSVCPQEFSFRASLILYITNNPTSSKLYQNLIQTCKFFFYKNPILVVSYLNFNNEGDNKWCTQLNGNGIALKNIPSKFWITNHADIYSAYKNVDGYDIVSSVIPKLYQSDVKKLKIWNQNMPFDTFLFLATNCTSILLYDVTLMNLDGTVVTLEKLIQILPKLIDFEYHLPDAVLTSKTIQELMKIPHFLCIQRFYLFDVSEILSIESLYVYIRINKKTSIRVDFREETSKETSQCLQVIVDEILTTEKHDYKVPIIIFPGINDDSMLKLFKFSCDDEKNQYSVISKIPETP